MDGSFHFLFQLQDRCEFSIRYTAKEAAEFYKALMDYGMEIGYVQCYVTNISCYIPIELDIIEPRLLESVLRKIQGWLDDAYKVGVAIRA